MAAASVLTGASLAAGNAAAAPDCAAFLAAMVQQSVPFDLPEPAVALTGASAPEGARYLAMLYYSSVETLSGDLCRAEPANRTVAGSPEVAVFDNGPGCDDLPQVARLFAALDANGDCWMPSLRTSGVGVQMEQALDAGEFLKARKVALQRAERLMQ